MKPLEFRRPNRTGPSPMSRAGALPYEDNIIRRFYPTEGASGCAKRMDRAMAWIQQRAHTLRVLLDERKLIHVGLMSPEQAAWLDAWLCGRAA